MTSLETRTLNENSNQDAIITNSNLEIISEKDQYNLNKLKIGIFENSFETEILLSNLIGLGVKTIDVFGKSNNRLLTDTFLKENNNQLCLYFSETEDPLEYDFTIGRGDSYDFNLTENGISGAIQSCIFADEIRKKVVKLNEFDLPLNKKIEYKNYPIKKQNILAIGAGGIGNYFALASKYLGHNVSFVDFDKFENKNNNRQIFCRPDEYKVKIIENELGFKGYTEKIQDLKLNISEFDVIVGCVDNVDARNHLRELSLEKKLPYFDGGVNTVSGQIKLNPTEFKTTQKYDKNLSCLYKPNPSVVIPNCIIGLQLANVIGQDFSKYSFYFDSFNSNRFWEDSSKIN